MPTQDFSSLAPSQVTVVFPRIDDGVPSTTKHTETVLFTSLALSQYPAGYVGFDGAKFFHETAGADYVSAAQTNAAQTQALATQIATDFYLWQLGRQFTRFQCIVPYIPEGLSEAIEWTENAEGTNTFVYRGPWNDLVENLNHYDAAGGGKEVTECCDGIVTHDGEVFISSLEVANLDVTNTLDVTDATMTVTNTAVTYDGTTTIDYDSITVNYNTTTIDIDTSSVIDIDDSTLTVTNTAVTYDGTTVIDYDSITVNYNTTTIDIDTSSVLDIDGSTITIDDTTVTVTNDTWNWVNVTINVDSDCTVNFSGTTIGIDASALVDIDDSTITIDNTTVTLTTTTVNVVSGTWTYTTTVNITGGTWTFSGGTVNITGGVWTWGTTSDPTVAPSGQLVITTLTVTGAPTYTGTAVGEVIFNSADGDLYIWDGSAWVKFESTSGDTHLHICDGRLSASNTDPNDDANYTALTTVYYVGFKGNQVTLYYSNVWTTYSFSAALSASLSGLTASTAYHAYLYYTGSAIALELSTTDYVYHSNGVPIKPGDATRRYVGRVYINSTGGQTEDNYTKRFIANYYNRVAKAMKTSNSTSHTVGSTFGPWNAGAINLRLEWVRSGIDDAVHVEWSAQIKASVAGTPGSIGYGLNDTTTINNAYPSDNANTEFVTVSDSDEVHPVEMQTHHNYVELLEEGDSSDTATMKNGIISAKVWV